jgi:hypothetical protein
MRGDSMIDTENGNLEIYKGFLINRNTTIQDIIKGDLKNHIKSIERDGLTKIHLKAIKINNRSFQIILYFDPDQKLKFLKMFKKYNYDWKTYKEELMLEHKIENDDWLFQELGSAPYKYWWGGVSSTFDQRGGGSPITIRYNQKIKISSYRKFFGLK